MAKLNTTITDEIAVSQLTALVEKLGYAPILEFLTDYAHTKADEIRDAHREKGDLEKDLTDSLKMVSLRQFADHLGTPTAFAIVNLD